MLDSVLHLCLKLPLADSSFKDLCGSALSVYHLSSLIYLSNLPLPTLSLYLSSIHPSIWTVIKKEKKTIDLTLLKISSKGPSLGRLHTEGVHGKIFPLYHYPT